MYLLFFSELETDEDDLELDEDSNFYENDGPRVRAKRHLTQYEYMPAKTRCPLLLVADYRFFQEMGGSNIKTTINYLVSNFHYLLSHFFSKYFCCLINNIFSPSECD